MISPRVTFISHRDHHHLASPRQVLTFSKCASDLLISISMSAFAAASSEMNSRTYVITCTTGMLHHPPPAILLRQTTERLPIEGEIPIIDDNRFFPDLAVEIQGLLFGGGGRDVCDQVVLFWRHGGDLVGCRCVPLSDDRKEGREDAEGSTRYKWRLGCA